MEQNFERPKDIKQISDVIWEIPQSFKKGMLVPARIYATKKLLEGMDNGVFNQVTNVACLEFKNFLINMTNKKLLDSQFWKNYNIGFYAGMASGISILIWQELTKNISFIILRIILL